MFAPTMEAPVDSRLPVRRAGRPARQSRARRLQALTLAVLGLATQSLGQDSLSPDQVFRTSPRTGRVEIITGVVSENSLGKVRVDRASGDQDQYTADEIVEIVWNSAPSTYKDGNVFLERRDYEAAVAMFKSAASDSDAREVVQAAARHSVARALLLAGGQDANRYAECIEECDRFLADYSDNRDLPQVRWLKARALRLDGKGAEAAQAFKALYEEGANDPATEGYDREFCLRAGLDAAEAFLSQGDTLGARELYATLQNSLQGLIAGMDTVEFPAEIARLEGAREVAALGEGFCLLVDGQTDQAMSFFEGKASNPSDTSNGSARGGALLGLGEALLEKGRHRQAQIEFAKVTTVDYSNRDHRARALLGLARASMKLGDPSSAEETKRYLSSIMTQYTDTPASQAARELLKSF